VRTRAITALFFGLVCLAVLPGVAAAQARPAARSSGTGSAGEVGLTYSILHADETTAKIGFGIDFAKMLREVTPDIGLHGVGEFGVNHFDGGTTESFLGGARFMGRSMPQARPFGQVLAGITHGAGSSGTNFTLQFGGGADIALTALKNCDLRVQVDFPIVFFDGGHDTGFRFNFGIALPVPMK